MSSSKRPWYKWFPKDFMTDEKVQSLSPISELVYRRLLDVMWQNSACRLLNVCLRLANVAGRGLTDEQFEKAWKEIQTEGFELFKISEDGKWIYSNRMKKQMDELEIRSNSGRLGGIASVQSKAKQNSSKAQANLKQTVKEKGTDTDTDTDTDKSINTLTPKKLKITFETFWKSYPNKSGKSAALKSWQKRKDLPDIEIILQAIENQTEWRKNSGGRFRPEWKNPATWINQGCWEDECDPHYGVNNGRAQQSNGMADIEQEILREWNLKNSEQLSGN